MILTELTPAVQGPVSTTLVLSDLIKTKTEPASSWPAPSELHLSLNFSLYHEVGVEFAFVQPEK